ncbi:MAG: DUF1641 domain-containing protein [Thermoproteus sp. AZ2]|jgi:uncharacterized protein YjgD (DUF1641 family)|uniref:DUF1641 domain-containing protein n=1 Tax=Thermoproteus sp. AZ2 TaxID=1609232 RepID=A0ACC6UY47_9CREN|nr:MAG: hypothetical protein TU35_04255 [Thermoproteus sp. AZ2]
MASQEEAAIEALERALSPSSLSALTKLLSILERADRLGLLDAIDHLLDPEVVRGLAETALTTGLIVSATSLDRLASLLASLSKHADALEKLLSALDRLEASGLLDTLMHLLEPETLGEAAKAFMSPGAVYLLNEAPRMLDEVAAGLAAAQEQARGARVGIIDITNALLRDEDVRRGLYLFLLVLKNLGGGLKK